MTFYSPSLQRKLDSAGELISWAMTEFSPHLVMTTAFGLNGVALIDLLFRTNRQRAKSTPVIFVDTGYHFAETLETKRRIRARYPLDLRLYRPDQSKALATIHNLYAYNTDTCCALRKVEPMTRALSELQATAILNGRARFQSQTRSHIEPVEWQVEPVSYTHLRAHET